MDQLLPAGIKVTLIHFTYNIGGDNWRIACMPNMTEFHQTAHHPAYQRSNATEAVSCRACKDTPIFKGMMSANKIGTTRG